MGKQIQQDYKRQRVVERQTGTIRLVAFTRLLLGFEPNFELYR